MEITTRIKWTILLLTIQFFSVHNAFCQQSIADIILSENSLYAIIKLSKQTKGSLKEIYLDDKISKLNFKLVDSLLYIVSRDHEASGAQKIKPLKEYKRQLVGLKTIEGKKFIFVNCFRGPSDRFKYWKKKLVYVYDGGSNFFSFMIDFDKKTYKDLYVNGI